mgnify:CR=1 FL=1
MKRSTDRILTTHAGRLPDPSNMGEVVAARTGDQGKYDELVKAGIVEMVGKQVELIGVYDPYLHYLVFNGLVGTLTEKAAKVSSLAKDVTEFLSGLDLPSATSATGLKVAYHSACSMQHGQKVTKAPRSLLAKAGFAVLEVPANESLLDGRQDVLGGPFLSRAFRLGQLGEHPGGRAVLE